MIHNNAALLGKLLSDDLTYVHSGGQLESKADVLKAVTTGKNVITRMEFWDTTVRVYGDTVLVKCRVDLWHSETNIVHMNLRAAVSRLSATQSLCIQRLERRRLSPE